MSVDTSREAVERLADVLENSYPYGGPTRTEIEEAAATLRALLAERDAERAEAARMREERDAAVRHYEQSLTDRSAAIVARMDAEAERDAAREMLPAAWQAGRDAALGAATMQLRTLHILPDECGAPEAHGRLMALTAAVSVVHGIALRPPPDLAEQLSRETKG